MRKTQYTHICVVDVHWNGGRGLKHPPLIKGFFQHPSELIPCVVMVSVTMMPAPKVNQPNDNVTLVYSKQERMKRVLLSDTKMWVKMDISPGRSATCMVLQCEGKQGVLRMLP